ncbi:MAG: 1,4-dihydroxy-2-naphthoate octaprenyltransferase [Smithellaceae bacterium]|nr:1,4-dihydroxy-2-naphthoate octaprenyltransferase [Smithellaceae bacterium]
MNSDKLKAWVQASRPPFFIATLIPLTTGAVIAGKQGSFTVLPFALVLVASFLVHFATNIANDYFDHLQGTDAGDSIGGSRVLQDGKITVSELRTAIILLYIIAAIIGLGLTWSIKLWAILPLMAIAAFSSLFYVAPPIRYGYHGLGELFVGVNMGPVMLLGSSWVLLGRVDWTALPVSIPIGLMVSLILYYQSIPDIDTDEQVGKHTLAARLGKKKALQGLWVYWIIIYLSIAALIVCGQLSPLAWLTFLTSPLLIRLWLLTRSVKDWPDLDRHGKYIRIFYFINGLIIIFSL